MSEEDRKALEVESEPEAANPPEAKRAFVAAIRGLNRGRVLDYDSFLAGWKAKGEQQ